MVRPGRRLVVLGLLWVGVISIEGAWDCALGGGRFFRGRLSVG